MITQHAASVASRGFLRAKASRRTPPDQDRRARREELCERRHGGRVEASGTVIVHAGEDAIRARIVDLAAGGVRMIVDSPVPLPPVGTDVRLDVRLDGVGRWLHLFGRLERVDVRTSWSDLVIEFHGTPNDFEDLVQNELLASLECAQKPHVLLVDGNRRRRKLVAEAFLELGFLVVEASSPLEAMADLDDSQLHFWAVAIADTVVAAAANELRRFMLEAYPRVPLIAIVDSRQPDAPTALTVDRTPDLALQVHRLVGSGSVAHAAAP